MITPTIKMVVAAIIIASSVVCAEKEGNSSLHVPAKHPKLEALVGDSSLDLLSSPEAYSRFQASRRMEVKHLGKLSLSGGVFSSEGQRFRQISFGKVWEPAKKTDRELYVEVSGGAAFLHGSATAMVSERFLYLSKRLMVESWTSTYGKNSWTNCEPLLDGMVNVGHNLYVGAASSCYAGVAHHEGKEKAKRVFQVLAGPSVFKRIKGKLDIGASWERLLTKTEAHHKKMYIGVFMSYSFSSK